MEEEQKNESHEDQPDLTCFLCFGELDNLGEPDGEKKYLAYPVVSKDPDTDRQWRDLVNDVLDCRPLFTLCAECAAPGYETRIVDAVIELATGKGTLRSSMTTH